MKFSFTCEVDLFKWGPCQVNYNTIDGDSSVGLPEDYEFEVLYGGDDDDYLPEGTDIVDMLDDKEMNEVIKAIRKDLEGM